jgi:transposase
MSTIPPHIQIDRLDDIPLLFEHLTRMEIVELIDKSFPVHKNWTGLSLGWTVLIWLVHILSQSNHCLSHVRDWVAANLATLQALSGIETLRALDFDDDRLAHVLRYLNKEEQWRNYEQDQG